MFEFDFRNIIVLISLGIHATLIWFLIHYGRKQVSGRAYLAAILAIAGWVIPMIFYRGHYLGMTLFWARILYAAASFTSTSFFLFTLTFPEEKTPRWWVQLLVGVENLVIVYLTFHPTLLITGVTEVSNAEDVIHFTKLYFLYAEHISLFFLAGFIVLIRKIRRNKGVIRRQLLMIFWGYFLASNLAMTTNLWMPWKGNFSLNWLGQFFSTLVAVFTTYAILKHRFLTPKVMVTELLIVVLNFILFIQLAFSTSFNELLLRTATFIGVLVISLGLLKSVINEVKRREEMERLKNALEVAYVKLQEVDQAKTDFLSMASHQLRSPLTVVRLGLAAMLDGTFGEVKDQRQIDAMNKMAESATRLINLIGEYLNVSRIELGKMKYNFKEQDLCALVKDIVEEYQPRAKQKKLKLEYVVDHNPSQPPLILRGGEKKKIATAAKSGLAMTGKSSPSTQRTKAELGAGQASSGNIPLVKFDEEKLRHVIVNIIDNAIKYTNKGKIEVGCELEGGAHAREIAKAVRGGLAMTKEGAGGENRWVQVSVKDTGMGLDKEDIAVLFQKFRRASSAHVRRREGEPIEGSGLGLHVAKMFVDKHGGKIWAESPGKGKGSSFIFTLPLSGPPPLSPEEQGEGGKGVELPRY